MDRQLKALAEPRRREILALVRDRELPAGEIASHFDVTRSAISQHLTVLKLADLISERRDGTRRLYRIEASSLNELRTFVDELWGVGLQRLKAEAEAEAVVDEASKAR